MRRRSFPSEIAIQTKIISGRKLGNIKLRYIVHTYVTSIWKTITISRSPNGTMVQGKDLKNTEECLLYIGMYVSEGVLSDPSIWYIRTFEHQC